MRRQRAMGRRGFLRLLGAAGAAAPLVVPATALGRSGSMSPNDRILAASIGARNRGNDLIKGVIRNKEVSLLAVCDVDEAIRAQRVGECNKSYEEQERGKNITAGIHDFREIMERTDIDVVLIATPDQHHAHMAIAAMKSGKDVYCEKPMTLTIGEGRAMADTAARYARVFQGFDYALWLGPAPWAPYSKNRCHYNFRFVRDYSGGEMTNFGAHFFDVAQWGLGADDTGPIEIEGKGEFFDGLWNTFSKVDLTYTYASGVVVHGTHKFAGCKFIGTEGWVDADRLVGEPMSAITAPLGANDVHLFQSRGGHMGNFVESVRTRGRTAATVEIGHRSATVCHLGNLAMALGRKLHDPTTLNRQGPDRGTQYRSAIFYLRPEQKATAEAYVAELTADQAFPRPLVTQIVPATTFWRAEEYHQRYVEKNGGAACHLP